MAKRVGKQAAKPERPAKATEIFSLRVTVATVQRVDKLMAKWSHLSVKRAAVLKLAIDRGLDVLEREK